MALMTLTVLQAMMSWLILAWATREARASNPAESQFAGDEAGKAWASVSFDGDTVGAMELLQTTSKRKDVPSGPRGEAPKLSPWSGETSGVAAGAPFGCAGSSDKAKHTLTLRELPKSRSSRRRILLRPEGIHERKRLLELAEKSAIESELQSAEYPESPLTAAHMVGLRNSVFRINSLFKQAYPYMYQPYGDNTEAATSVGTGWVLSKNPLLIVTNAHVVQDAVQVTLQFPVLSDEMFEATVLVICQEFDLAIVALVDEDAFLKAASKGKIEIPHLPLAKASCAVGVGSDVVSVGFALGARTAKFSRGIISGMESQWGYSVCQTTAPISPGNSGGPLVLLEDGKLTVTGVVFASAIDGQNINFVIPAYRVRQVVGQLDLKDPTASGYPLVKLFRESMSMPGMAVHGHVQVRLPELEMTATEGNEVLSAAVGGCRADHLFVSGFSSYSVLAAAKPDLPKRFFLLAVDEIAVDKWGYGRAPDYVDDTVNVEELLSLRQDLAGTAEITICAGGKESNHEVPLRWQNSFERPIPVVLEPSFAKLDFELFAGITFMELTQMHADDLVYYDGILTLSRFLMDSVNEGRLFVSNVDGSSDAFMLERGMILDKVNGETVRNLEDYRRAFQPKDNSTLFTLETDQGLFYAANFTEKVKQQVFAAMFGNAPFMLTPAVQNATGHQH